MIKKIAIIISVWFVSASGNGFDDSFIWKGYFLKPHYKDIAFSGDHGISAAFLHSNIYRIEGLNWNYFSIGYDKESIGVKADLSSMGLKEYYQRDKYRIQLKYRFFKNLGIMPSFRICSERFLNFGNFTGLDADIFFNIAQPRCMAGIGLSEIPLKKPYPVPNAEKSRPFAVCSAVLDRGVMLSVGIRRFDDRRTRWIFDQSVAVNGSFGLNFGYENNPPDIYGGLDLVVKGFSLILNYHSIGGLSDSIVWGITFKE